jgi:hypothetical protein
LPEAQQSPDAIRALEAELAVLNPTKTEKENPQIAQGLRVGELTSQIDILDSLPEEQKNKSLIKRLNAELSFLVGNTKAEARTSETKNAREYADSLGFVSGSKEWQTAYAEKFAELISAKSGKANIIGVTPAGLAVFFDDKDGLFVNKIVDGKTVRELYAGVVNRSTANVTATATSTAARQEEAFSIQRGKDQAQALTDAATNARAASQAITSITTMKQLDQTGQLVTGPLANSYVGASNLLASIGLLSKNQVSILTSSQVYDKSAKDLVMQDLGGKLGAQISDADRKFVEDRIPQLTTSAKARTELLDKIEQIQKGKIAYYGKMKAHANKNRNLDDFDFSEVYTVTPPVGSPAASSVKSKADAIIKGNP